MAKYIEATELEDEAARDEVMDKILVYCQIRAWENTPWTRMIFSKPLAT